MKPTKFLLNFFILTVFLISITAISAVNLNDTGDFNVLNDVSDEKSFKDLNSEIEVENSSFTFESNYGFNSEIDKNYSDGIIINKDNFSINGNNHRIDCNGQSRAFYITGENVEINNLIIENAFCGYGSAIRSDSQLTLNNVTFINCFGDNKTYSGGAIYSYNTTLNVNNCRFIDNGGENGASITSIMSAANVVNSTFISSSDKIIKGQIFLSQSILNADNSNFLNTTSRYAAAIFSIYGGMVIVKNSKFKNLFASKTAGAIGAKIISNITVSNCEFDNVSSINNGGAIFADIFGDGNVFRSDVLINNSVFRNCYSGFGGVVLQLDGNLVINNTNFTSNTASYEGGAVYTSHTSVEIYNSRFTSNRLIDGVSYGGACYFDEGNTLLNGNDFVSNSGYEGSAVYAYDNELSLIGNNFNNPSNGTSIHTVYGKIVEEANNNYTSDVKSFNNTNYFYNFEGSTTPLIIINNTISFDQMPVKFDLRNYSWVTPVKNQGFMGACWAFGNMAALESSLLRYTNKTYSLSVNNMQNSMIKYSKYGMDTISEGGNPFTAVAYLIDWLGVFPEEFDGYDELGKISSLYITPDDIHIQNVVVIPPINATNRDLIKNALINYGAVAASHCADFNESKYFNKSSSAQYCYDVSSSTHRICIVGWDDNYSRYNFLKTPEGDGAWICKNSWGTNWGDGGYFYLSYYDTSCDKESVCYIINNDSYARIYQHDVGGDNKWVSGSRYYANIYTADEDELISAVGTFFNQSGMEYEFTISVNDVDVHTQKGISKLCGYETVKLDKLVQIKKGDKFKVTFKNMLCVAHDLRIHPQANQSFVSGDGKEWEDLSTVLFVAILKVYTVPDVKIPTEITLVNETLDLKYGDWIDNFANLTPADAGNLTFTSSNESVVKVSEDGTIVAFGKGTANVTVSFAGDDKYAAAENKTIAVTVSLKDASVSVENPTLNLYVDDAFDLNATTVPSFLNVQYSSSNESVVRVTDYGIVFAVGEGTATITLTVGEDVMFAVNSINVTVKVNKKPTKFANVVVIGNNVSLTLKDINGNVIPDANVSCTINGVSNTFVTDTNGSFDIVGEEGVEMVVDYLGSDIYIPTSISIKFASQMQSTVILGNNFTQYALEYDAGERGQNFTVQLKDVNGNVLANKTVLIGYNGKILERVTNATGHASVQINLRDANRLTFAVTFLGDEDYNATMSVYLITINKKPVTITAAAKTYKATAKTKKYTVTLKTIKGSSADGKVYFGAGKKVTMKINGKTYTAKTNAKGQATFSLKITKKGKFAASIKYAGDNTYKAVSKQVKITIK